MSLNSKGKPTSAAAPKWKPVNLGYGFKGDITSFIASEENEHDSVAAVPKPTVVASAAAADGAKPAGGDQQLIAEELQQRLGKAQVYEDPEEGVVHAYTINRGLREANGSSSASAAAGDHAEAASTSVALAADGDRQGPEVTSGSAAPTRAAKFVAKVGLSPFVTMHQRRLERPVIKAFRGAADSQEGYSHAAAAAGDPVAGRGVPRHVGHHTQKERSNHSVVRINSKLAAKNVLVGDSMDDVTANKQRPLLGPARMAGLGRKRTVEAAAAAAHAHGLLRDKRAKAFDDQQVYQLQGTVPGRALLQVSSSPARNTSVTVVIKIQGKALPKSEQAVTV
jgi:hypothetical protein